jgi:predicted acyltransferase
MPMTFLYHAHSGLRYLVLLAGVIAAIYFTVGYFARRPDERLGRVLMGVFVGVLDLQILLGILLVLGGIYYPMLIGHLSLMVLAAVAAHAAAVLAKRPGDARRAHGLRLMGILVALALIVAGVSAIGRGLFESRAPMALLGL